MPAIGHLIGIGQCLCNRFAISTTAIARDGRYRRVSSEPGSRGVESSVRQQSDRSPALQVAYDRSVGLTTPESKVIDAYDKELIVLLGDASTDHP